MVPHVPLVGWDVALTPQGAVLLEMNISCNFFMGSFNEAAYYAFCRDMFVSLDTMQLGSTKCSEARKNK
jgi:hypothetical protein